jgi:hypothetical protein
MVKANKVTVFSASSLIRRQVSLGQLTCTVFSRASPGSGDKRQSEVPAGESKVRQAKPRSLELPAVFNGMLE